MNGNGNLGTHINKIRLHELQPALDYMNLKERRQAVSSLVTSITNYCAPMYIGQRQEIKHKYQSIVRRCYRALYKENTYMMRCEVICERINIPMPLEYIGRCSMHFIYRVICKKILKFLTNDYVSQLGSY